MRRLRALVLVVFLSACGWAATTTFVAVGSGSTSATTNGTSYASGSFTPAANDLIVFMFAVTGKLTLSGTPPCTDSLGGKYALYTKSLKASSVDAAFVFVAQQLAANSAMTITCTTSATNATGGSLLIWRVSGITRLGTLAMRQHAEQNNQASATPAPVFPQSVLTGNPTIGWIFNATTTAATMTAPTSWTEPATGDTGYSTPTTGVETVSRDSGFTGTTVTWGSSSSSAFSSMVVEIDTTAQDGDFSTVFPATENPISQSSKWKNGLADGLDWTNMQTTPGEVFGNTQSGATNDPTAVLNTGQTWAQTQTACGVLYLPVLGPNAPEIELRLNTTIAAHSITGYELDLLVSTGYSINWVRWDGTVGTFTIIGTYNGNANVGVGAGGSGFALVSGDYVCAYNNAGAFRLTINGVEPFFNPSGSFCGWTLAQCGGAGTGFNYTASDSTYTAGFPGVGSCCNGATMTDHGWSSFVATGVVPPRTPTLTLIGVGD